MRRVGLPSKSSKQPGNYNDNIHLKVQVELGIAVRRQRPTAQVEYRDLNGDDMNSLTNVMALFVSVHTMLELWFALIPVR